jgi:hypothetical protein
MVNTVLTFQVPKQSVPLTIYIANRDPKVRIPFVPNDATESPSPAAPIAGNNGLH